MTELNKFTVGEPVWSKMKGYCPWPSRIAAPSESSLRNTQADKSKTPKVYYLVYFFGSNNFAWMPEDTIKPYEEHKEKNKNGSKNAQFKQGLKQIEEYIAKGGKASLKLDNNSAISNDDNAKSPSEADESLSNDNNSNADGDLPSIDDEIAAIHNKKPSAAGRKLKNSNDSQHDSSLTSTAIVQKDYSRTPFKSRKSKSEADPSLGDITSSSPVKRQKVSEDEGLASSPTVSTVTTTRPTANKASAARNVLLRATNYSDVPTLDTPLISMSTISIKNKNIRPSPLKFGFIGLGFLGQRLLKNLLNSGHQVTIWNRTSIKCKEFVVAGADAAETPSDVVTASNIVFACLPDPKASKEVVFGSFGVLGQMDSSKGYVELSSIDPETSNDISEAIIARGGRYLEAPLITNGKLAAEAGDMTIVASGDKTLYEECSSCFQAMSRKTFFLGHQPGYATKMNLTMSMLYGAMIGALSECCSMVERSDLQLTNFRDILKLSIMNCPLIERTIDKIIDNDGSVHMPLGHLQKDLRLSLNQAEECQHSCPITAITNEVLKTAKRFGADDDVAAVYAKLRYS